MSPTVKIAFSAEKKSESIKLDKYPDLANRNENKL